MNGGCEAGIGFIGPHGDTFEFFELAEEVFDEMSPFIDFEIDGDRLGSTRVLGDDDLGTALVEFGDDGIAVEGLVRDQSTEIDVLDERFDADGIEPLPGQQNEVDQIAERIGQCEDLGRHSAFGATNGLALSPPFAPCP